MVSIDQDDGSDDVRARILAEAAAILADQGREALTTRALAAAARVQAPTIYRLFGDDIIDNKFLLSMIIVDEWRDYGRSRAGCLRRGAGSPLVMPGDTRHFAQEDYQLTINREPPSWPW